jgi:Ca2+-binding RTX toxin-like protein
VSLAAGSASGGDAEGDVLLRIENLTGSAGNDTLEGDAGNNTLAGGAGVDLLSYAGATAGVTVNLALTAAQATGGAGTDVVGGFENLLGSAFADELTGATGANRLDGGAGNDTLTGGAGNDTLDGGGGDDLYFIDSGLDVVLEGASQGTDEVRATASSFTLGANIERLVYVGSGNFTGTGNSGAETIIGGAGADTLRGVAGNDSLWGGDGADVLVGGAGVDSLTGGSGSDQFRFALASETGLGTLADRITDFFQAQGDRIDLSAIDANAGVTGDQAFGFIGTGAFVSGTRGQLRFENRVDGNTWVQADLDGDRVADFEIMLIGSRTLTATDFVL